MPEISRADSERLSKLVRILEDLHFAEFLEESQRPIRLMWTNFLIGTMRGLGFVFGTALIIAAGGWIFRTLGGVPLLGAYVEQLVEFVQSISLTGSGTVGASALAG